MFLGANGELLTLVDMERIEFPEGITVYNFTVDGNHNYFVIAETDEFGQTSVLVHNAGEGYGNPFVAGKKLYDSLSVEVTDFINIWAAQNAKLLEDVHDLYEKFGLEVAAIKAFVGLFPKTTPPGGKQEPSVSGKFKFLSTPEFGVPWIDGLSVNGKIGVNPEAYGSWGGFKNALKKPLDHTGVGAGFNYKPSFGNERLSIFGSITVEPGVRIYGLGIKFER